MNFISRRGFIASATSAIALAGCQSTTQSGTTTRTTADGRPIATTRAEPLNAVAARFGIEPVNYAARPDGPHEMQAAGVSMLAPEHHRQVVPYSGPYKQGTLVIDNGKRQLFLILSEGHALRYGISVGREGFTWRGRGTIYRRAHWPTWTPTANMIRRTPALREYAGGYPGGPSNPLGARALYLLTGGADRGYRIHGTPEWWLIGQYVSSGCIRMINQDVADLYERVPNGARVITI
ncbi:putative L,D-transpeptidase YbiS [Roseibaca ekhonensis]|jgi:lipoprotein-anchoring transpeptidase ErfK/SrfK|uniref:Putative L,D-transpeptidase YbiS n=1 Tax=Roseinatronobacter ekhonensis TaxID=254356 RepID=A0A3B0MAX1_9RHOB|nr:L,D-transpeptidase [Roseibaca ekhonensis]SUZ30888.1 putative L,D-transpeptidase YbiS [Roseibaca ekhonensis]